MCRFSYFDISWIISILGGAISCYTCSSRNGTDQNCHDPFHPAMSTYTEGCKVPKEGHIGQFPANFCIKVIGKTGKASSKKMGIVKIQTLFKNKKM